MKIDIFAHIMPVKYKDALLKVTPPEFYLKKSVIDACPMIYDLGLRFREMDKHEGLKQVLTISQPPLEAVVAARTAVDLARIANDEMAELVAKYQDRFVGAVACLPMNDMDAALSEVDRTIKDLKFIGIQLFTPTLEKPLDLPEFMPLYEKMAKYDLPIWIHPKRTLEYPDYRSEQKSKYVISNLFGWPYETTVFMTRLIFAGIFDKYPRIKFITHHAGAMVPFFEQRIVDFYDKYRTMKEDWIVRLARPPIEYFKMFYVDTAVNGSTPALMCAYAFYGAERLLFATDMPLGDAEGGFRNTTKIIQSVERMAISDSEKKMIFGENARELMHLNR